MKINDSIAHEDAHFCYESSNTSCLKHVYPTTLRASVYALLVTTILLTVFGNLLVIIAIACSKQLHTPTNYLILSLAVADFLLGSVVMPPSMVRSLETCWYFGTIFCQIHSSMDVMLSTASIFNLSLISIDRYFAVSQPLQYQTKITIWYIMSMILTCWSLSAVYGFGTILPGLNNLGIQDIYNEHFHCKGSCIVLQNKATSFFSSLFMFFGPGILMVGLYLKIILIAHRQMRAIQITSHISKSNEKSRRGQRKMESKATKTLGIVIAVYLFCWTPFFVCIIVEPDSVYSLPFFYESLLWIGYSNSGINPIVYAFLFKWFRKSLKIVFKNMLTFD